MGVLVAILREEDPTTIDMVVGEGRLIPTVCAGECQHSETMCTECVDNWQCDYAFDIVTSNIFPLVYPN